jgi:hypothetical protein
MTSLEAQAELSAAEILFLHRYSFNSTDSTTQNALFLNSQQRWLAGVEYLEPVFNVLRSHAELGSLEERAHLALVINRQLYFERARNLPGYSSYHFLEPEEITDALVLEALTHVRETQERYGDQQIINPTVISFYSNELDEGVNRFGGEQVRTRLHELAPTVYEYRGEPGASLESPRLQEMLNHIRHSTTPITVLIAAHGSMRGVYLDAGSQPSNAEHPTLPIEAIENAFIDRYTMHPELRAQAEAHPDTIIFDNCFGGNLEGYVYSRLADRALPVPAMVSGSEEGAVGYTTESIYGSDLLEAILRAPHATLRDVVRADMLPRPFTRMNRRYGDFVVRPARNTEETANDDVTVFLGGPRRVTATERNLQLSENEDSSTMQG